MSNLFREYECFNIFMAFSSAHFHASRHQIEIDASLLTPFTTISPNGANRKQSVSREMAQKLRSRTEREKWNKTEHWTDRQQWADNYSLLLVLLVSLSFRASCFRFLLISSRVHFSLFGVCVAVLWWWAVWCCAIVIIGCRHRRSFRIAIYELADWLCTTVLCMHWALDASVFSSFVWRQLDAHFCYTTVKRWFARAEQSVVWQPRARTSPIQTNARTHVNSRAIRTHGMHRRQRLMYYTKTESIHEISGERWFFCRHRRRRRRRRHLIGNFQASCYVYGNVHTVV